MANARSIAVITGASRGLGLETARVLAGMGFFVIVTARTEASVGEGVSALAHRNVDGRELDVSVDSSVANFYSWLHKKHGPAVILVNNAGRAYRRVGNTLVDTEPMAVADAINNNALGAYRMIRFALPEMNRIGFGRIVNVSSGMGQLAFMGGGDAAYRISKTAMNAVTRVAASEAKGNVKVNSVCPGWVRTDMGGAEATRSLEEGAAGIVWAATLPDSGPNGGFFRDGRSISW
jgi:NAD(P)-dependent dehydrogenase (short-subunit alcohol dehydrogenase family)